jgi:hypothetical protein
LYAAAGLETAFGLMVGALLPLYAGYWALTLHAGATFSAVAAQYEAISSRLGHNSDTPRDCQQALALTSTFRPNSMTGAVLKRGLWMSLYEPQYDSNGEFISEPCITTLAELEERLAELQPIASAEATALRRVPVVAKLTRIVADTVHLSPMETCLLNLPVFERSRPASPGYQQCLASHRSQGEKA